MNHLIFQNNASQKFFSELLASELETAAILLARPAFVSSESYRLLVAEVVYVPSEAYERRSGDSIVLSPEFLAGVIKRARHNKYSIFLVHTHPWHGVVKASPTDRYGEQMLFPTLFRRVPGVPHGRLILGFRDYDSVLRLSPEGAELPVEILDVGPNIRRIPKGRGEFDAETIFDRQVRAFGKEGQSKIQALRVAVIGLGGTGSVIVQQLAHLGCKNFLLIDPDLLEETNLNRVVGASLNDLGRPKVKVAEGLIHRTQPSAEVVALQSDALHNPVAKRLLEADLFFCCTDSHGSRAILNQLSYQYLLPGFDLGVQIEVKEGVVTHMTGRVQMLAPGLACLVCSNLLDSEAVRRDLMTEAQRRADPYIPGAGEAQPAVISLNSTVASLAITMYLGAVAGIPAKARHQIFRAEVGSVRVIESNPFPSCVICSGEGALGKGDDWNLPGRP